MALSLEIKFRSNPIKQKLYSTASFNFQSFLRHGLFRFGIEGCVRDLSWFPYDEIQLAIEKQAEFLSCDAPLRSAILSCFQNEILPYWEEKAELEMKGGKGKRFDLYLVNTIRKE